MSGTDSAPIFIRAISKSNGITATVLGLAGICLSTLWLVFLPKWLFLAGIFLTSASIVALLIGWFKLREPEHSIEISPENITYHHRRGNWVIHWDNVQRVDCPRVRKGLDQVELEAIGIRLKNYSPFLRNVSPRLATHLLMEQRPLLMQQPKENCSTGNCFNETMFDDKVYTLDDGVVLTGVKAMLANRMAQLRDMLGYDVFISSNDIDREPAAFVSMMRQCQEVRLQREMPISD